MFWLDTSGSPWVVKQRNQANDGWVEKFKINETLLAKQGGTMTGALILSGDPAQALEAATKQYVDNKESGHKLFTSSGSFTVPANVTKLTITPSGGGGGGGGGGRYNLGQGAGGGGGGVGAVAIKVPVTVVPEQQYTVTVGAAGSGGAGATSEGYGSSGGSSGTSSFGSLISRSGDGGGGPGGAGPGGAAGSKASCLLNDMTSLVDASAGESSGNGGTVVTAVTLTSVLLHTVVARAVLVANHKVSLATPARRGLLTAVVAGAGAEAAKRPTAAMAATAALASSWWSGKCFGSA